MLIRGTPDILKPPSNPLGYSGLDAVPRELFAMNTVEDQVQFFANEFPWYPTTAVRYYLNTYGPDDFGGPMWGYLLGHVQNLIDTESALLEGNKRSLAAAQAEPSGAAGDPALWAFAVQQGQAKLDQLLRDKAKVVDYQAQWQVANATEQEAARARVDAYWEDQRAQAAAREAQRQAEVAARAAAEEIRYAQAQAELQAQVQAQAIAEGAALEKVLLDIQNREREQYGTVLTTSTVAADAAVDAMNRATTTEEAVQLFQENLQDTGIAPPVAPPLVTVLPKDLDKMDIFQQAKVYNMLVDAGNSDGQILDAVEYVYGPQSDANWQLLQRAADDARKQKTQVIQEQKPVTEKNLFPESQDVFPDDTIKKQPIVEVPAPGANIAPLLLAVAAAAILGG